MIILHKDFDKYAIWQGGTVVGLKEGATKNAKDAWEFFKDMENKQAEENEKAIKEGRFTKRFI